MADQDNSQHEPVGRFERERRAVAREARVVFTIVLIVAALIYALSGLTSINQDEVGLHFRLGELVGRQEPGLHMNWPWPIDEVVRLPNRNASRDLGVHSFNLRATDELNEIADQLAKMPQYRLLKNKKQFWSAAFDPYLITGEPENRGFLREVRDTLDKRAAALRGVATPSITTRNVMHMGIKLNFRVTDPKAWYMQTAGNPEQIVHDIVTAELIHFAAKEDIHSLLRRDIERARHELRYIFQGTLASVNTTYVDLLAEALPPDARDKEVYVAFNPAPVTWEDIENGAIRKEVAEAISTVLRTAATSKPLQTERRLLANEAAVVHISGGSLVKWWKKLKASRRPRFRLPGGMGMQLEQSGGVAIIDSRVPQFVTPSFDEVTNARARQGRTRSEAKQKSLRIVSAANIRAGQIRKHATGEAEAMIEMAGRWAEGFETLAVEYKKNPVQYRRRRSQEAFRELAAYLQGRFVDTARDPGGKRILRLDLPSGDSLDLPPGP